MKISIVIPAHNEEACLAQTIRCALDQDYQDSEVIVVNNASTDRTEEISRAFPEITLINEPRKGLLWARISSTSWLDRPDPKNERWSQSNIHQNAGFRYARLRRQ